MLLAQAAIYPQTEAPQEVVETFQADLPILGPNLEGVCQTVVAEAVLQEVEAVLQVATQEDSQRA